MLKRNIGIVSFVESQILSEEIDGAILSKEQKYGEKIAMTRKIVAL